MSATVDYDECVHSTAEAVLLRIDADEVWMPRSVIDGDAPEPETGPGSVEVAEWWATHYGLT